MHLFPSGCAVCGRTAAGVFFASVVVVERTPGERFLRDAWRVLMDAWRFGMGATDGWIGCCLAAALGQSSTCTCVVTNKLPLSLLLDLLAAVMVMFLALHSEGVGVLIILF